MRLCRIPAGSGIPAADSNAGEAGPGGGQGRTADRRALQAAGDAAGQDSCACGAQHRLPLHGRNRRCRYLEKDHRAADEADRPNTAGFPQPSWQPSQQFGQRQHGRRGNQSRRQDNLVQGEQGGHIAHSPRDNADAAEKALPERAAERPLEAGPLRVPAEAGVHGQGQVVLDLPAQFPDRPDFRRSFQGAKGIVQSNDRQLAPDPDHELFLLQADRRIQGIQQTQLPEGERAAGQDRKKAGKHDLFPIFPQIVSHSVPPRNVRPVFFLVRNAGTVHRQGVPAVITSMTRAGRNVHIVCCFKKITLNESLNS